MTRMKSMLVGAVNIKLVRSHSTKAYVSLFEYLDANNVPGYIWSNHQGIIKNFQRVPDMDPNDIYAGEIYRFIDLKKFEKWVNAQEGTKRFVGEKGGPPKDSKLWSPEISNIPFVFWARQHKVFFDANELTPRQAYRFFGDVLEQELVTMKFGYADVELISSIRSIEEIFDIPNLRELRVVLTRPNPDISNPSDKKDMADKMKEKGIHKIEVKIDSEAGKSLKISEGSEEYNMVKMALADGYAVGTGTDKQGAPVRVATNERPLSRETRYDPTERGDRLRALIKESGSMLKQDI